jgi:hypothetical protein
VLLKIAKVQAEVSQINGKTTNLDLSNPLHHSVQRKNN